jgi:hypothetical protein
VVHVEVNNGAFVERYDIADVPTVGDIVRKFQDDHRFRFAADPKVFDSSQNSAYSYDTPVVDDGRTYAVTCWITQQLDKDGIPVKRSVLI